MKQFQAVAGALWIVLSQVSCVTPQSDTRPVKPTVSRCVMDQSPATAIAIAVVDTLWNISADLDTRRRHFASTVTEEVIQRFLIDYTRCVSGVVQPAADRAVSRITKPVYDYLGVAQSVVGDTAYTTQAARRAEVGRRFVAADSALTGVPDNEWGSPVDVSKKGWPRRPTITGRELKLAIEKGAAQRGSIVVGASVPEAITTSALTFATVLHDELEAFLRGNRTEREVAERLLISLRFASNRAVDDDVRPRAKEEQ